MVRSSVTQLVMAKFELLGDTYGLSKEELASAPQSLLTQAAELLEDKTAPVALDKWPEPHKGGFEVRLFVSVPSLISLPVHQLRILSPAIQYMCR